MTLARDSFKLLPWPFQFPEVSGGTSVANLVSLVASTATQSITVPGENLGPDFARSKVPLSSDINDPSWSYGSRWVYSDQRFKDKNYTMTTQYGDMGWEFIGNDPYWGPYYYSTHALLVDQYMDITFDGIMSVTGLDIHSYGANVISFYGKRMDGGWDTLLDHYNVNSDAGSIEQVVAVPLSVAGSHSIYRIKIDRVGRRYGDYPSYNYATLSFSFTVGGTVLIPRVIEMAGYAPAGAELLSLPYRLQNSGPDNLASVVLRSSDRVKLITFDTEELPYLVPGDSLEYTESLNAGAVGSAVGSYGVGVTPFPIFDSGYNPLVIYYVPDLLNAPGFPLGASLPKWHNSRSSGASKVDAENLDVLDRLSLTPFLATSCTRWGINTAYRDGASVILSIPSVATRRWVKFWFDPSWGLVERVLNTQFDITLNSDVHTIMQSARPLDPIVGYRWIGHGYWNGASKPPFFIELGRTYGANIRHFTPADVAVSFVDMRADFLDLLLPRNVEVATNACTLGTLAQTMITRWLAVMFAAQEPGASPATTLYMSANRI